MITESDLMEDEGRLMMAGIKILQVKCLRATVSMSVSVLQSPQPSLSKVVLTGSTTA